MRFLLSVLIVLCSYVVSAQHYEKFVAFSAGVKDPESVDTPKFKHSNVLVFISKKRIKVYSKKPWAVTFIGDKQRILYNGAEGLKYKAVDDEGKDCEVLLIKYIDPESYHLGTLAITYTDHEMVFRLKKPD